MTRQSNGRWKKTYLLSALPGYIDLLKQVLQCPSILDFLSATISSTQLSSCKTGRTTSNPMRTEDLKIILLALLLCLTENSSMFSSERSSNSKSVSSLINLDLVPLLEFVYLRTFPLHRKDEIVRNLAL